MLTHRMASPIAQTILLGIMVFDYACVALCSPQALGGDVRSDPEDATRISPAPQLYTGQQQNNSFPACSSTNAQNELIGDIHGQSPIVGSWLVEEAYYPKQLAYILEFLLEEFSRLLGQNIMFNEFCIVYNDPQAECPMLIRNHFPIRIRLAQNVFFEPQTVFQLSHEMCHYAFRQYKENKDFTLSWFEEIVCEAVSLYALEYVARNGQNCPLSKEKPSFSKESGDYLYYELGREGSDGLKQCDSVVKLAEYEAQKVAENHRETHRNERHALYRAISANPEALGCVLDYTKYLENNGVVVDFDRWIQDNPCDLLNSLRQIQPVKQEPSNSN